MTRPDHAVAADPVRQFTELMPRYVTDRFHLDQTSVAMVHAAIRDRQWTAVQLAKYVSRDLAGIVNPGPRVLERLRHAAGNPPTSTTVPHGRKPLCDDCEDGWLVDEKTRLPVRRCNCRTTTTTTTEAHT